MEKVIVEQLVTAAQRLELADWERRDAETELHALVREHSHALTLPEAERLTLLPSSELRRLLQARHDR